MNVMKPVFLSLTFILTHFFVQAQNTGFSISDNGDFFQNGKKIGKVIKTANSNILTGTIPEFTVYDVNGVARFLFENVEGKFIFLDDNKSFLPRIVDAYAKRVAKFFASDSILTPQGYNVAYRSAFIKKHRGYDFSEKKERDYNAPVKYIENNILQGDALIGRYEYRLMDNGKDALVAVYDLNNKKVAFITTTKDNSVAYFDMEILDANQKEVKVFEKEFDSGQLYKKGIEWIVQNGYLGSLPAKVNLTLPVPARQIEVPARQIDIDYGYGTADARAVTVGTQEWLGKNLNVDRFANGDRIPEARTALEWKQAGDNKQPAWCYYNNDPANGRTYGKLYNWYAVHDPRGLAPSGWHVPSDEEWTQIINYLGGDGTAGLALKNTSGWENNGNGNNSSGIAGLPGGYRSTLGSFTNLGENGTWWSSSENDTLNAWTRYLYYNFVKAFRNNINKSGGFSVRCLRD